MTDDDRLRDWKCTVTLCLDDVTRAEAHRFFDDGVELEWVGDGAHGLIATVEAPGPITVQP